MYWDEEPYYEPTPADEIFYEAQQKLVENLKESVKNKLDSVQKENEALKQQNEELQKKIRDVEWREKQLNEREKDLERNMIRKKFSEMIKPLEEQMTIWRIAYEYVYGEKCNKCNDERKIEFKSPSGKKMEEYCSCSKTYTYYFPEEAEIIRLALYKNRNYPYDISVTPKYDSSDYDDTYCKFELETYIDSLEDFEDMGIVLEELDYRKVGFKNLEDCQKFADFLNKKNNLPDKIVKKVVKDKECEPRKRRKAIRKL